MATGILAPENAAFNLRAVLVHDTNVEVTLAEIVTVDLAARRATARNGAVFHADYLVLAAGSTANFFGIPGAAQFAFPMYSLQDAERLRSRLLELLEAADRRGTAAPGPAIVIVGAGATGVETAGAIADILQRMPPHLYPHLDRHQVSITLVDKGATVLPGFTAQSQAYAAAILGERGVTLRLGAAVREVSAHAVLLADGSHLQADAVIWAGGLKASGLAAALGLKPGHGGRLDVQSDLTLAGYPCVYALGDFANCRDASGKPLPQLAAVAQQAGRHCAANIAAHAAGDPQTPFVYLDKGVMAMIGRNAAVAEIGARHHPISGVFAFAAWLGVHVVLLTTVRAKMDTFLEWAWDYFGRVHVSPVLDRPTWWQPGGAPSASGRTLPGIEARTPSDHRERPGQKVASHVDWAPEPPTTPRGPRPNS